ncbi:hypothetical protein EJ06DRAFT_491768 [Trichodelitschia bisporula]|uniref:Integral membrane protein, Mpv17/PMP22 family n=1 Tax=Trichodelitschia bisporula TaxID=703511 RepID=A0A6G1I0T4_9PEZI|nr:hypothetical protein EJ06DRAFT_491768 [Trichodelitschia bisporula]
MAGLFRWYTTSLQRRPLVTQMTTTAVLFGTGDILAQRVFAPSPQGHDISRTARMATYGGLIFGPAATAWYKFLARMPVSGATGLAARIGADQLLFTPVNLCAFLSFMAATEGASPRKRLAEAFWPAYKGNLMVWPAVQAVNFTYVPLAHRVLVVNVVALGWNSYLAVINGRSGKGAGKG